MDSRSASESASKVLDSFKDPTSPDGGGYVPHPSRGILEIKTCSPFVKGWEDDGVPSHYIAQVHRYMAAAGLESIAGDQAQVIVAISVKTSSASVPEQGPRGWRMRLNVQKVGDTAKVSNVQLVP